MSDRMHRCRRSCCVQVPRSKAFCRSCWAVVPRRVQTAILASWGRVQKDTENYGAHVELLMEVEEALEGERPWESVHPS